MDFYGSDSITILRKVYSDPDEFGMPTETLAEIEINGVFVSWGASSMVEEINRLSSNSEVTFYLPYGTDIRNGDNFLFNDEKWERAGTAQYWQAPPSFGSWTPGVVVNAKRVEG